MYSVHDSKYKYVFSASDLLLKSLICEKNKSGVAVVELVGNNAVLHKRLGTFAVP